MCIADNTGLGTQLKEKDAIFESEGQVSTHCSAHGSQNTQGDCVGSFAAFGETQINGGKENPRYDQSPSCCDNKSAFSSMVRFFYSSLGEHCFTLCLN